MKRSKNKYDVGDIHLITGKIKIAPNTWRNFSLAELTKKQREELKQLKFEHVLRDIRRGVIPNVNKDGIKLSKLSIHTKAAKITERFMSSLDKQLPLIPQHKKLDTNRASYPNEVSDFLEDNPRLLKTNKKKADFIDRVRQYDSDSKKVLEYEKKLENYYTNAREVVSSWKNEGYDYNRFLKELKITLRANGEKTITTTDLSNSQLKTLWDLYRNNNSQGKFKS